MTKVIPASRPSPRLVAYASRGHESYKVTNPTYRAPGAMVARTSETMSFGVA